jgi:hypothetical protein
VILFDTFNFSSSSVDVSAGGLVLQQAGTYFVDFFVRGAPDSATSLSFGIRANKSTRLDSTVNASEEMITPGLASTVTGFSLVTFPDLAHGVTTGQGTILELQNMSTASITLKEGSVNATLRILKIST